MSKLTENLERIKSATDDLRELVSMTDEDTIEEVVSEVQKQLPHSDEGYDVQFFDYDGTLLYHYTREEFLELEEMPANPTHEGLTAQGWNWTFEKAQSQVETIGKVDIGQLYTTTDGYIHMYVTIPANSLSVGSYISKYYSGTYTIDWGDGSGFQNYENISGNMYKNHTYSSPGDYIIKINASGSRIDSLRGYCQLLTTPDQSEMSEIISKSSDYKYENKYCQFIKKLELATMNIDSITRCNNLETITTPKTIAITGSGGMYLDFCPNLKCFIMTDYYSSVAFKSSFSASYCDKLSILVNASNTSFYAKNSAVSRIVLSPQSYFYGDYALKHLIFKGTSTSIPERWLCYSSIKELDIPDNITTIGNNALYYMDSNLYGKGNIKLEIIHFPKYLQSIGNNFINICYKTNFEYAYSITRILDFSRCEQIPTVAANFIYNYQYVIPKIVVPDELYEDWIVATNWSKYSSLIIRKSDYDALQNE